MLNLSDVTFCIKSFRRFSALLELVQSVSGRYPHSEILVADDSFDATPVFLPEVVQKIQRFPNLKWLQMPFDSGLSRGRNLMVDECKTEFLVMLDDDFLFTGDTDISKWPDILSGCDLVSGYVEGYKNRWTNPQSFFVDGKTLCCKYTEASCSLFQTELFLNFFMVRTATIRNLRWDDQFKITSEHIDFLLRFKESGLKAYCDLSVKCRHNRDLSASGYYQFRGRRHEFLPLFSRKWGITKFIGW